MFLKQLMKWVYAQALEGPVLFFVFFWGFLNSFYRRQKPPVSNKGCPIFLIHGYLNTGSVWDVQKIFLRGSGKGLGPFYTLDLGSPFSSIESHAQTVAKQAEQIAKETGRSELILVGHSMGGLVSLCYALTMAPPGFVSKIITIGSPLQGTHVAKIGLGKAAREMERGSSFVKELELLSKGTTIPIYHIGTKTDQIVIPYESSFYPGPKKRCLLLSDIGHASLLFSKRVANQLAKWLAE